MAALAIPAEVLVQIVVDACTSGGKTTLTKCTLVCWAWHQIVRPLLFYQVKITTDARLTELEQLLRVDPAVRSLVRILIVQPCYLGHLVASPWLEQVPRTLAALLPRLHTIHLDDICDFGEHVNAQFVADLTSFATVTQLAIHNAIINFDSLISVAAALPALEHVEFGNTLPMISFNPPPPRVHYPRLLSLGVDAGKIESRALGYVLDWLNSSPSLKSLRQLMLGVYQVSTGAAVGKLLEKVGPGLDELELRIGIMLPAILEAEVIMSDISFARCTALRSFTLRHPRGPVSRTVLKLLADVPAPERLHRLTLGVLSMKDGEDLPSFAPLSQFVQGELEELCILYVVKNEDDSTLSEAEESSDSAQRRSRALLAKLREDLPQTMNIDVLSVSRI